MNRSAYRQFSEELQHRLEADNRVLALVAVGSMAAQDYFPDEWSDHDFFVIVQNGCQESFRSHLEWLPANDQIVFMFRETEHGIKVLYSNAHLLEFAIFNLEELHLARINRYRLLIDRANLQPHLDQIVEQTKKTTGMQADDLWSFGQFLTSILVGVGRHRRGEQMSGRAFVKTNAVHHLIALLRKHISSPRKEILDDLDGLRRFEFAYPDLARDLNSALEADTPDCGKQLIQIADRLLKDRLANYPVDAVNAVLKKISNDTG
jgi:hypothetical protein